MYGKPAMTWNNYQVYLYGSEALPLSVWQHNLHRLEENSSMVK
jgi:hypothetical protein